MDEDDGRDDNEGDHRIHDGDEDPDDGKDDDDDADDGVGLERWQGVAR